MLKFSWNYYLAKSHFSYTKECFWIWFANNFRLECSPSQIHGLCATFASISLFMRLLQAPLDTCLGSPFFASLSVHGLQFTVYAASTIFSVTQRGAQQKGA